MSAREMQEWRVFFQVQQEAFEEQTRGPMTAPDMLEKLVNG